MDLRLLGVARDARTWNFQRFTWSLWELPRVLVGLLLNLKPIFQLGCLPLPPFDTLNSFKWRWPQGLVLDEGKKMKRTSIKSIAVPNGWIIRWRCTRHPTLLPGVLNLEASQTDPDNVRHNATVHFQEHETSERESKTSSGSEITSDWLQRTKAWIVHATECINDEKAKKGIEVHTSPFLPSEVDCSVTFDGQQPLDVKDLSVLQSTEEHFGQGLQLAPNSLRVFCNDSNLTKRKWRVTVQCLGTCDFGQYVGEAKF